MLEFVTGCSRKFAFLLLEVSKSPRGYINPMVLTCFMSINEIKCGNCLSHVYKTKACLWRNVARLVFYFPGALYRPEFMTDHLFHRQQAKPNPLWSLCCHEYWLKKNSLLESDIWITLGVLECSPMMNSVSMVIKTDCLEPLDSSLWPDALCFFTLDCLSIVVYNNPHWLYFLTVSGTVKDICLGNSFNKTAVTLFCVWLITVDAAYMNRGLDSCWHSLSHHSLLLFQQHLPQTLFSFLMLTHRGKNLSKESRYKHSRPDSPAQWVVFGVCDETYYVRLLFTLWFAAHYPSADADTFTPWYCPGL